MTTADIPPGFSWRSCPRTVQLFIAANALWIGCALVNSLLQFDALRAMIAASRLTADPGDVPIYALVGVRTAVVIAVFAWAVLGRSLIARLLIALQWLGWLRGVPSAAALVPSGNMAALPYLLGSVCATIAVVCLLTPGARRWFSRKETRLAGDVDSFA